MTSLSNGKLGRQRGMQIFVTFNGKRETAIAVRRMNQEIALEIARAVNITTLNVHSKALRRTPNGVASLLRARLTPVFKQNKTGAIMAGRVEARSKYAAFVEFGTSRMGAKTNKRKKPKEYVYGTKHKYPGRVETVKGVKTGTGVQNYRKKLEPFKSIKLWARATGQDPYALAAGIAGWVPGRPPGIHAQPYLGPSFDSERRPFAVRIRAAVQKGQKRSVK